VASKTKLGRVIDRFIASTHPRAPLAGKGDMLVRAASKYGVDPRLLAVIARKESEFGTTSGRFKNNAWGWGVKLGPGVYTAPSWEVMAERVAKGLSGDLYKGAGLTTAAQILPKYAPAFENNTAQYISQVNSWMRQMGANPNQSVFGTANAAAAQDVAGTVGVVPAQQLVPGAYDKDRLLKLLMNQQKRTLRGIGPAPGLGGELAKLFRAGMPQMQTIEGPQQVDVPGSVPTRVTQQVAFKAGGGPEAHGARALGNWQSDNAYDLMGKTGDPVFAGVNGVVTKISGKPGGDPGFAGYGVTVKTNQGEFFYKHLGSRNVKVGQRINPRTLVGGGGATTAGGPHLHLGGTNRKALDNLYRWYLSGGGR
jgi:murein DD-endopeptidase MepM/ murein hydrolase activator NlpD